MCYKKDAGQLLHVEREIKAYSDVIAKVDNQMLQLRKRTEGHPESPQTFAAYDKTANVCGGF